jgi:hypothetical protein
MSVVSIFFGILKGVQVITILVKMMFVFLWTWFLNYLCIEGYKDVAWFLVLLPFILMLGIFVIAFELLINSSKNNNNSKYGSN